MALVLEEPGSCAGDVACEPVAVSVGHHRVLSALPDGDGHADGAEREAPVAGWRDDDLAFARDWGFPLGAIRVPVTVWQGRQDAMVPHAHGDWLARHVPGAQARLFEDEGHISLVERFDDVVNELVAGAG